MSMKLVIGNRNYSSWSLRAWLFLRESGLPFEELRLPLFMPGWAEAVARYSPAGRVPVLVDGDISVWDTMAIIAHVQEQHPSALGWPADPAARAEARSIAAEMHAGFLAIRGELPQNLRLRRRRDPADLSADARAQIARVCDLWSACRRRFAAGGPWLFGRMSTADVMYAPVALRFVTYDIPVPDPARSFIDAVCALPAIQEWIRAAEAEVERIDFIDELVPAPESPLTLG